MNAHLNSRHTLFCLTLGAALGLVGVTGCDDALDEELELELALDADPQLDFVGERADEPGVDELPGAADLFSTPETELPVAGAINLALGKPTTQSSTAYGGDSSRAVDGNTDGIYWNNSVSHTNFEAGWWQVDLLESHPIGEIVIHNRTDCCGEKLHDFDVEVSMDGVNWVSFHQAGAASEQTRVLVDRVGRYVRIANPEVLHLAEVEVFRTRNLAYAKPTTQSSTDFGGDPARAVDGNTDGLWWNNSVSHTGYGVGEWWQVDLEGLENIGTVILHNRTDCCQDQLGDFVLGVSNDGEVWHEISYAGSPGAQAILSVNREARYLRVTNGEGYLHLAEVQVFEAPRIPGLSYGRGAGSIPAYGCGPGDQYDAGLCYQWCAEGYHGVGPVCWEDCAEGYTDMGLTCTNWNTLHTYWKDSYGRGAGSLPIPTCPLGDEYDAGLCYQLCDEGYDGVGPVCWAQDPSIQAVGNSVCGSLRVPFLAQVAQDTNASLTLGVGLSASLIGSMSTEIGVAYGEDGQFGCYISGCAGGASALEVSAYTVMARYWDYETIAGQATVASVGFSPVGSQPFTMGGEVGQIVGDQGVIGSSLSAGINYGYSTPITLGVMSCETSLFDVEL